LTNRPKRIDASSIEDRPSDDLARNGTHDQRFQDADKGGRSRGPRKVAVILPHEEASIEAINDAQVEVWRRHSDRAVEPDRGPLKNLKIPLKRFEIYNEKDADRALNYGVQLAVSGTVDILLKEAFRRINCWVRLRGPRT